MKQVFAVVLSVVLVINSAVSVYASDRSLRDEAMIAGAHVVEVVELIMSRYLRNDYITVETLLEAALRGMTDELDHYSVYLSAEELSQFTGALTGRIVGIGVSMLTREDGRVEVTRVFADSPAQYAGVLPGDVIAYIDGYDVRSMTLSEIASIITDPDTERVVIGFEREDIVVTFDILKAEIRSPTVIVERIEEIADSFGLEEFANFRYVQISTFGLATGDDVRMALDSMRAEGVEGIVLDLRGNTGGYLDVTVEVANLLVPAGAVLQTVNQAGRRRTYSSTLPEAPFDNMVVLVNRFTASAAEVIASALQDSGSAVIVGEPTFGKGLVQSVYSLRTGGALKLTTEEYFRRNGGTINEVGVIPCIEVERRDGWDFVLRRGLEELLRGAER